MTDFAFEYGDHTFDVTLTFSGPGAIRDWVSFNPQPDPPGVWFADAITFAATGDPSVSFSVSEDRSQLSFATPEPSTWVLMGLGFTVLSVLVRRAEPRGRPTRYRASRRPHA